MQFLEKNLEDIIFNTPNHLLRERGLAIYGKKKRQVRIGNYGVADILVFDKGLYYTTTESESFRYGLCINVLELKQEQINVSTLLQATRYAKGISSYLTKYRKVYYPVRVCLIGSSIDKQTSFPYLSDFLFEFMSIYTYKYDFDGIKFNREFDYKLPVEGF